MSADPFADLAVDVIEATGEPVTLVLPTGEARLLMAGVRRNVALLGDYGQVVGQRDTATIARAGIDKPPFTAELHIATGRHAGRYRVDAIEEDDSAVWRLIVRSV